MSAPIRFKEATGVFGELSNFRVFTKPLVHEGKSYASSEHLYQCAKYAYEGASEASLAYAEEIRCASTPYKAKILAAQRVTVRYEWQEPLAASIARSLAAGVAPRQDWELVKLREMERCVTLKFRRSATYRAVLLSTGESPIEELNPFDEFWATGRTGTGRNELGKLLVRLRTQLRSGL